MAVKKERSGPGFWGYDRLGWVVPAGLWVSTACSIGAMPAFLFGGLLVMVWKNQRLSLLPN